MPPDRSDWAVKEGVACLKLIATGNDANDGTVELHTSTGASFRWFAGIEMHEVAVHPGPRFQHLPMSVVGGIAATEDVYHELSPEK